MWGKGGVQWSEPLQVRGAFFLHSNANFKSLFNCVELVVTNLTMVYDLWNKPMVSIANKELKYEGGHLPLPSWLRYWTLMKFGILPGISSCFGKDLPHCFKMFSWVRSQTSFAYYQLTEIEQVVRLHLEVIFEKRNKLNCGGSYHFLSTWY